jgi:hypothetical protein
MTASREPAVRLVGGRTHTLSGVRALLSQALDEARAIDEPLVAYFIEMAIEEASAKNAETRPEIAVGGQITRMAE